MSPQSHASVGHVHLKVADLERAIAFYRDVLGFELTQRYGDQAAFLYPDRKSLAEVLKRVLAAGIELDGAADHGVSEALYLRDPDGNGVEIYRDRAPQDWPRDASGQLSMVNAPLDVEKLLSEAD